MRLKRKEILTYLRQTLSFGAQPLIRMRPIYLICGIVAVERVKCLCCVQLADPKLSSQHLGVAVDAGANLPWYWLNSTKELSNSEI